MSKFKQSQEVQNNIYSNVINLLASKVISDYTKRGNLLEEVLIDLINDKSSDVINLNNNVDINIIIPLLKKNLLKKKITYSSNIKFKTNYCNIKFDAIITSDDGELFITEIKTNYGLNSSEKQNAYNRFIIVRDIFVNNYNIDKNKINFLCVVFKSGLQGEKIENLCAFKNYGEEYVNCMNGEEFCNNLRINYNTVISKISINNSKFHIDCKKKLEKLFPIEHIKEFYDYLKDT